MASTNLLRLPGRTLLGAGALMVGVAALALLVSVNLAFRGTLVGTLLGEVISVQVRGVDYLSVALAIALGGLSVASAATATPHPGEYSTFGLSKRVFRPDGQPIVLVTGSNASHHRVSPDGPKPRPMINVAGRPPTPTCVLPPWST